MNENEYEKIIMEDRRRRQNPYAHIDGYGNLAALVTEIDSAPLIDLNTIREPEIVGQRVSFEKIEEVAKSFQNIMWQNRHHLWEGEAPDDPVAVLDLNVAFKMIGYRYELEDSLGQFMSDKGMVDVAGYVDKSEMYAGVSSQFSVQIQNFTGAHELGHAVLHEAMGMHRDRALNGEAISGSPERVEVEANKFASYFLMPEKLVRSEFEKRFLSKKFVISEDTAFALGSSSQDALRSECADNRRLARKLANCEQYQPGRIFESLTERFKVSTEAMAIRLEELNLLRI